MAQIKSLQVESDLALQAYDIKDFSGGLQSDVDPGDLPPNAASDCENVYFRPGRMLRRDGSLILNRSLTAVGSADGIAWFYDANLAKQMVVWSNGNLYSVDLTTFVFTLVASGVYTAGLRICSCVMARVLYFSDGETIGTSGANHSGIRSYDPANAPGSAPLVISSGTTGTIPTPACKVMCMRAGQLLIGRIKYVGGTYSKDSIMWSNVYDATTFIGTNIVRIGEGEGGEVNALSPMQVSAEGISPFDAVFCGLSDFGVYCVKGALTPTTVQPVQINCAVGCLDGGTVQFIPSPGYSTVVFLGTDRKVYSTNGVDSNDISTPISTEIATYVSDRMLVDANATFASTKNIRDRHYVLDLGGGVQYCYDWILKYWTRYRGWTSGYWTGESNGGEHARDASGNPIMYCVENKVTGWLYQVNIGTSDSGVPITPYWISGWISPVDKDEVNCIYKFIALTYRTDVGNYVIECSNEHGTTPNSQLILSPSYGRPKTGNLWGVGIWGVSRWQAAYKFKPIPLQGITALVSGLQSVIPIPNGGPPGTMTIPKGVIILAGNTYNNILAATNSYAVTPAGSWQYDYLDSSNTVQTVVSATSTIAGAVMVLQRSKWGYLRGVFQCLALEYLAPPLEKFISPPDFNRLSRITGTQPYHQKGRLYVQKRNGARQKLQGHDIMIKIYQTEAGWFEVLNINFLYLVAGRRHVGGM